MEWNWMVEEFGWIILSRREHTHQHQAYTWADVEILTMIEDMIVGTTDMKTMITGTEEDHLLLIIVGTDHDQDLDPTAQDAINKQSSCS